MGIEVGEGVKRIGEGIIKVPGSWESGTDLVSLFDVATVSLVFINKLVNSCKWI